MVETLLTEICVALIVLSLLILINSKSVFTYRTLLVLFFAVFFIDNLLIVLTNRFSSLQIIPNTIWEGFLICGWSGKLYSIVVMIILLFLTRKVFSKEEAGFTFRQTPSSILPACIVTLLLAAWALFAGVSSSKGKFDLPTLAYLAIMPGLNEEIVYRGILLAILIRIIPGNLKLLGAPLGWGIIVTSLLFGLLHGFWLDKNLAVHIEMIALRNATISGLILPG
jgi:membrane protease YdiL (CAAX protease family)